MTVEAWLVSAALGVLALWMVASLIDAVGEREPATRIVQPPRQPIRPYPEPSAQAPWHPEFALTRVRHVRAARCRDYLED
ncbi:hypothetical protein [Streptomyces sp. NPDC005423]|uniref:hypothetical protein n=1 Tax=Streptomyces sp. NPDC005423 TaxID=3155343 RepID=UPI0033B30B99